MDFIKNCNLNRFSIFGILAFLFILATFLSPSFLSENNLINVLRQVTVVVILAYGQMMLIIAGQIDLSQGSVLALSGVLSAVTYKQTHSLLIALAIAIIVAVACNFINAIMVANFAVPAFIATLAMAMMARGGVLLYTKGQNILQLGDFVVLGQGSFGLVPIPVVFLIGITLIVWYLMTQTKFGRSLYAIGGNEYAATASGISARKAKYKAYLANGVLVGIAGALFMSRVNAGLPNGALNYELQGLTATIVGGTSFTGGIGTTFGTLAGALIIGVLNNIMNLTGQDSYVQQIVTGAIIALAVMYDIRSKQSKRNTVILKARKKDLRTDKVKEDGATLPGAAEKKLE